MKKKSIIIILLLIGIFILFKFIDNSNNSTKSSDITSGIEVKEENIDWDSYEEKEINSNNLIEKEGIYTLSGEIDNMVVINTTGNVKLILNNVTIKNSSGPAIYVENADNVEIYLEDGSINTLEDGNSYSDTTLEGVIYSKDDLIINGNGTLIINANYQDGIVSNDDLEIISGNYIITSEDDGIRGKDSVVIKNGNFAITSSGDAIKSTNETDTEKGYILIENGTFEIVSTLDGIQAETELYIKNGIFNIKTGCGSSNKSTNSNWGYWGYNNSNVDNESAKGLKSGSNLILENGTYNFDTSDDAIHTNGSLKISRGIYIISSGDDGIHADSELIIENGTINIKQSYEGIEATKITIEDGNIELIASDDGINVAGGNDSSSMNRPGSNNYQNNSNNILTINGGNIKIDATGDGIDINGSGYINGGKIVVLGPTNDGNGSLDYDSVFAVNGGTLIAIGSSGMAQSISSSSSQYGVMINLTNSYKNSTVTIKDSNNNTLMQCTNPKSFSSVLFSSSSLKKNENYTLLIDNEEVETFTITSISTNVGNNIGMGYNQPPGRR